MRPSNARRSVGTSSWLRVPEPETAQIPLGNRWEPLGTVGNRRWEPRSKPSNTGENSVFRAREPHPPRNRCSFGSQPDRPTAETRRE